MKIFYGWKIVAIACICYGFGISPAYYSWGFYFPELQKDLGFTKADLGAVFGIFTFLYSGVGPIVGILQRIIGVRACMTIGSIMAAVGFLIVSNAHEKWEFFLGFSVLGGIGIGMSTIIPTQTLGQSWFTNRRALVIAIIMCSGGIVGFIIPALDTWVIETFDNSWRTGWQIIACISVVIAFLAAIGIRDTPEKLGLEPYGHSQGSADAPKVVSDNDWNPMRAIMTKQFFLITIAGVAYATPWGVVVSHGRTHLSEQGFELSAIGLLMGSLAFVSIFGRLTGILSDKINPRYVIIVGLILEGLGTAGFYFVEDLNIARICLLFIGIGFGSTYICIPVIFSDYFGRKAFGTTAGSRMFITGIFNGLGPYVTGLIADRTDSYFIPFMGLGILSICGAVAMIFCTHPGPPPEKEESDSVGEAA